MWCFLTVVTLSVVSSLYCFSVVQVLISYICNLLKSWVFICLNIKKTKKKLFRGREEKNLPSFLIIQSCLYLFIHSFRKYFLSIPGLWCWRDSLKKQKTWFLLLRFQCNSWNGRCAHSLQTMRWKQQVPFWIQGWFCFVYFLN